MRYGKNHNKKGLERHRRAFTRTNFVPRCLVYPCRDYILEVVSAPLKFWAPVSHYIWHQYVYTTKIGSGVPKNRQHGAKNLACRAAFLARGINGVFDREYRVIIGEDFNVH